jgi:hypothetical protein
MAYTDVKAMLSRDKAAFSKNSRGYRPSLRAACGLAGGGAPRTARGAGLAERLNFQLTAYAEANLAFERENERLTAAAALHENRAKGQRAHLGG